jgi:RhoGEF domain
MSDEIPERVAPRRTKGSHIDKEGSGSKRDWRKSFAGGVGKWGKKRKEAESSPSLADSDAVDDNNGDDEADGGSSLPTSTGSQPLSSAQGDSFDDANSLPEVEKLPARGSSGSGSHIAKKKSKKHKYLTRKLSHHMGGGHHRESNDDAASVSPRDGGGGGDDESTSGGDVHGSKKVRSPTLTSQWKRKSVWGDGLPAQQSLLDMAVAIDGTAAATTTTTTTSSTDDKYVPPKFVSAASAGRALLHRKQGSRAALDARKRASANGGGDGGSGDDDDGGGGVDGQLMAKHAGPEPSIGDDPLLRNLLGRTGASVLDGSMGGNVDAGTSTAIDSVGWFVSFEFEFDDGRGAKGKRRRVAQKKRRLRKPAAASGSDSSSDSDNGDAKTLGGGGGDGDDDDDSDSDVERSTGTMLGTSPSPTSSAVPLSKKALKKKRRESSYVKKTAVTRISQPLRGVLADMRLRRGSETAAASTSGSEKTPPRAKSPPRSKSPERAASPPRSKSPLGRSTSPMRSRSPSLGRRRDGSVGGASDEDDIGGIGGSASGGEHQQHQHASSENDQSIDRAIDVALESLGMDADAAKVQGVQKLRSIAQSKRGMSTLCATEAPVKLQALLIADSSSELLLLATLKLLGGLALRTANKRLLKDARVSDAVLHLADPALESDYAVRSDAFRMLANLCAGNESIIRTLVGSPSDAMVFFDRLLLAIEAVVERVRCLASEPDAAKPAITAACAGIAALRNTLHPKFTRQLFFECHGVKRLVRLLASPSEIDPRLRRAIGELVSLVAWSFANDVIGVTPSQRAVKDWTASAPHVFVALLVDGADSEQSPAVAAAAAGDSESASGGDDDGGGGGGDDDDSKTEKAIVVPLASASASPNATIKYDASKARVRWLNRIHLLNTLVYLTAAQKSMDTTLFASQLVVMEPVLEVLDEALSIAHRQWAVTEVGAALPVALNVLSNVCYMQEPAVVDAMASSPVVPKLLERMRSLRAPAQEGAGNLLTILSYAPSSRELLVHRGALRAITPLMSADDPQVRHAVSSAHENMRGQWNALQRNPEAMAHADDPARRLLVLNELVETEKTYVEVLLTMVTIFLNPLSTAGQEAGISQTEIKAIFSIVEMLSSLHTTFLQALQRRYLTAVASATNTSAVAAAGSDALAAADDIVVGDLLFELAGRLKIYKDYINNYAEASKTLSAALRRDSFKRFIDEQLCGLKMETLSLHNCLITPIQRIPRYKLLMQQLIDNMSPSNPDYDRLSNALTEVQAIADFLDSENAKVETIRVLSAIAADFNLKVSGRQLLLESQLASFEDDGRGRAARLFLFDDVVLYARSVDKQAKDKGDHGSGGSGDLPPGLSDLRLELVVLLPLSGLSITDAGVLVDKNRRCHSIQLTYYERQLLVFGSIIAKKRFLERAKSAQRADKGHWATEMSKHPVKVFIEDNPILEPLGLNNTHRTLVVSGHTNAREMRKQMITKMCKAMTQMQIQTVAQECVDHRIYLTDSRTKRAVERVLAFDEYPWRYLSANPEATLWFKPYPPRTRGRGGRAASYVSAASSTVEEEEDDDDADVEDRGMLRTYLPDNVFLRQLGFENTFKTLLISSATTAKEMERMMIDKMTKGMGDAQANVIRQQCSHYYMHWFTPDHRTKRRLNPLDKPWKLHKTMNAGLQEKHLWSLFFIPVGVPHFGARGQQASASSSSGLAPSTSPGTAAAAAAAVAADASSSSAATTSTSADGVVASGTAESMKRSKSDVHIHGSDDVSSAGHVDDGGSVPTPTSSASSLTRSKSAGGSTLSAAMPGDDVVDDDDDDEQSTGGIGALVAVGEALPRGRRPTRSTDSLSGSDGAATSSSTGVLAVPRAPPASVAAPPQMASTDGMGVAEERIIFADYQVDDDQTAAAAAEPERTVVHVALSPTWSIPLACAIDSTVGLCRSMLVAKLTSIGDARIIATVGHSLTKSSVVLVDSDGAELFDQDRLVDVVSDQETLAISWQSLPTE